jgi:glutamine phosphoribosylpyrophosphate amidotransferase
VCGIAGFSRTERSTIDPIVAARVLLASVADRGADACGFAYESADGIVVVKDFGGAHSMLRSMQIPSDLTQLVLHVRDHTKGRPSLPANNHPIRHGGIVGVHNGKIANDDALIAELGRSRAEAGMTVDSEAIFAALDAHDPSDAAEALELLRGSLATCWLDERTPGTIHLARGYGRPLWLATTAGDADIVWASTLEALEIIEEFLDMPLHKRPIRPGTVLTLRDGRIVGSAAFEPDRSASWLVNPVASAEERSACLAALPHIA